MPKLQRGFNGASTGLQRGFNEVLAFCAAWATHKSIKNIYFQQLVNYILFNSSQFPPPSIRKQAAAEPSQAGRSQLRPTIDHHYQAKAGFRRLANVNCFAIFFALASSNFPTLREKFFHMQYVGRKKFAVGLKCVRA